MNLMGMGGTQLFQLTAIFCNFLVGLQFAYRIYRKEGPQQDLKEGPHRKSCDLDTKGMFYLLVYIKLSIARPLLDILLSSKKDYTFQNIHCF